jgi:Sec-independent protein translocase protein TatA
MEHGFIGWLFIIVALIFIFGGRKRLEDLGAGFGGFMREFNKARAETAQPLPAAKVGKKRTASRSRKGSARRE